MILYKIGEIVYKNKTNIIFENKGDGYIVNVPDIKRFEVGMKCKIYLYEQNTEFYKNTYGFKEFKERLLFTDLITVEKVGPKIAMIILDQGWEKIAKLIITENWKELSKINFVSEKTAKYICVELKNKWSKLMEIDVKKEDLKISKLNDLTQTLSSLGFKKNQIDYALENIKENNDFDKMIEESITLIANNKNETTIRT
ncbi:Holliday junction DNA helicase RuvA [Mycoplasmopsis canis UFG4]|uniref:Holliday junction branch migration complex subunit RuvA n=2 Tax=Mycoplasmopsis canis TaxID=29555 RepID=I1A6V2_9BACT|nr:Holliday junction branch migration protein RuvA [Mycoplasmopsis canis]AKF41143.1 ATP-dependent DNA helicase RuvA [Mycoplasmopsis canis]AMD81256.1 ATP-dependent DNA helicase RuvA [Mycoplasmopsis canis PG 14]EIE40463.1 Holliday junction DNA helicase RuvA [Mycoplasmopsis canis UF31]EIE40603.1 Holliday junction DNA helicase RuvA [Mycoplasmopsis canis PG 14]EIE40747.1 Holliday junction DNA helicase RuvA [Mycoplasmopsis canis UF33]